MKRGSGVHLLGFAVVGDVRGGNLSCHQVSLPGSMLTLAGAGALDTIMSFTVGHSRMASSALALSGYEPSPRRLHRPR